MLRKNFMNILLGVAAAGVLLMGYNAFLKDRSDTSKNATSKISSYLGLVKTSGEAKDTVSTVEIGGKTDSPTTSPDTTTVTPTPEVAVDTAPVVTQPANAGVARAAKTYVVLEGDTYGCIAEKYYGSFEHYVDVMAANNMTAQGFSEYGLFVGATLQLPAVSQSDLKPATGLCS